MRSSARASTRLGTSSARPDLARLVARFGPSVASTTEWGAPAFDLPEARARSRWRKPASTAFDDLDVVHRVLARLLLVPARRRHRAPGGRRGQGAVTRSSRVSFALPTRSPRCGRASRRGGARGSRPRRRHAGRGDQVRVDRRGAGGGRRGRARPSARTAPRSCSPRRPKSPGARWHFLGRLQRNKVRALAPWVACWQSRRPRAPRAPRSLGAPRRGTGPRRGEPRRRAPEGRLCGRRRPRRSWRTLRDAGLLVDGLMTVPPRDGDPRRWFSALRELGAGLGVTELSMGMTRRLRGRGGGGGHRGASGSCPVRPSRVISA